MSNICLIGVSGRKSSGKDTFAKLLVNKTGGISSKWEIRHFAAKLKQIAAILLGVPVEAFEDRAFKDVNRKFLQDLGEGIRKIDKNAWITALFAEYNYPYIGPANFKYRRVPLTTLPHWVIGDLRYENEYQDIKNKGGICVRIERDLPDQDSHISEHEWRDLEFDWVITNNGSLSDLETQVDNFIKQFGL